MRAAVTGEKGLLARVLPPPLLPLLSLSLLFFLDALPPATFEVVMSGWVPTLSLTAYVRARPAPGPLRIRQVAHAIDDGRVDETCEVWDVSGRLVGQATQLAGIRLPIDAEPRLTS